MPGEFDGTAGKITGNDIGFPAGGSDRTFACWIKLLSTPGGGSFYTVFAYGTQAQKQAFYLLIDSNRKLLWGAWISNADAPSNTALTLDVWQHISVVFSGNVGTYYLNGVADGTGSLAGVNTTLSSYVLGIVFGDVLALDGIIDESTVLNKAATADEMMALYQSRLKQLPILEQSSSNVFYLPLENKDGTSGNGQTYQSFPDIANIGTGSDGGTPGSIINRAEDNLSYVGSPIYVSAPEIPAEIAAMTKNIGLSVPQTYGLGSNL